MLWDRSLLTAEPMVLPLPPVRRPLPAPRRPLLSAASQLPRVPDSGMTGARCWNCGGCCCQSCGLGGATTCPEAGGEACRVFASALPEAPPALTGTDRGDVRVSAACVTGRRCSVAVQI